MAPDPVNVLLVESDPAFAAEVRKAYRRLGRAGGPRARLVEAKGLAAAQQQLERDGAFALAIVAHALPDGAGLDGVREIVRRGLCPVVLTGPVGDTDLAVAAMAAGAIDYAPRTAEGCRRLSALLTAPPARGETLPAADAWADPALQASEVRFARLLDNVTLAAVMLDLQGQVTFCNRYLADLLEVNAGEAVGSMWFERFLPPQEQTRTLTYFREFLASQTRTSTFENAIVSRLGRQRLIGWSNVLLFDSRGEVIGVASIGEDITERRRGEEDRARLITAIEQADEGVIITDPAGAIVYVNPAFERMTGYASDEILGENPRFLKSEGQDETQYAAMWRMLHDGRPWRGRLINRRKSGERFCKDMTISPVRDESGAVVNYVAVSRDISHEVNLENQLRQAQKVEAIGTLAGGIAHDFNNILQAVLGFNDLILETCEPGSETHECATEIRDAGRRAVDLVRQILSFSRQTEQRRSPILLQPVIKECLKLMRRALPTTVAMVQDIDAECGAVQADPTQIHQVIMNLCANAWHAMREQGGALEVTYCAVGPQPRLSAELLHESQRHYARLSVRDNGVGMTRDILERLYDPYFTTKIPGEGTGLGLATVQGIVTAHEGEIIVESEPGAGSVFHIYLPICPEPAVGEEDPPDDHAALRGREQVLFVDDEETIVHLGCMALERFGYRVTGCSGSLEALMVFRNEPTRFDVVVTDLTMPTMRGDELARVFLQIRPELPIIICTGYSEVVDEETAKAIGVRSYVMKPMVGTELARAIREACGGKRGHRPGGRR